MPEKQQQGLRDRVARLEIWIEKLFFHLSGRNEGLMAQMRAEAERKMRDFTSSASEKRMSFVSTLLKDPRGLPTLEALVCLPKP
jgi:hypothetical protein